MFYLIYYVISMYLNDYHFQLLKLFPTCNTFAAGGFDIIQAKYMVTTLEMKVKLSKRVENIVAKGDIAHYEQFLQFHQLLQCFQIVCAAESSEHVCHDVGND